MAYATGRGATHSLSWPSRRSCGPPMRSPRSVAGEPAHRVEPVDRHRSHTTGRRESDGLHGHDVWALDDDVPAVDQRQKGQRADVVQQAQIAIRVEPQLEPLRVEAPGTALPQLGRPVCPSGQLRPGLRDDRDEARQDVRQAVVQAEQKAQRTMCRMARDSIRRGSGTVATASLAARRRWRRPGRWRSAPLARWARNPTTSDKHHQQGCAKQ